LRLIYSYVVWNWFIVIAAAVPAVAAVAAVNFWVTASATAAAATVNQFETTLIHITVKILLKCLLIKKTPCR
jgi:hypothetical protein